MTTSHTTTTATTQSEGPWVSWCLYCNGDEDTVQQQLAQVGQAVRDVLRELDSWAELRDQLDVIALFGEHFLADDWLRVHDLNNAVQAVDALRRAVDDDVRYIAERFGRKEQQDV